MHETHTNPKGQMQPIRCSFVPSMHEDNAYRESRSAECFTSDATKQISTAFDIKSRKKYVGRNKLSFVSVQHTLT
jgi:hypothetical protein